MIDINELSDELTLRLLMKYGREKLGCLSKKELAEAIKIAKKLVKESAAEDAKKKGLEHMGHGIYGKNGKELYKVNTDSDKLVAIKKEVPKSKESFTGKKEQEPAKKVNIFDVPELKLADKSIMKKMSSSIQTIAPKMSFANDAEKKEFQSFLSGLDSGTLTDIKPDIINKYIRVGPNQKDPKIYIAAKTPNDFSQLTRKKVEKIGQAVRNALLKSGIKLAASITTSSGNESKIGRGLNVQGLFPSKEDPSKARTVNIKIEKTDEYVKIGNHQINHIKEPSLQILKEMIKEIYAKKGIENPTREAKFAQKAIQKHNESLKQFASILSGESSAMIDVLPGTSPDNPEGRKKLITTTSDSLMKKIQSLVPNSKSESLIQTVLILKELPKYHGEDFEAQIKKLMSHMSNDEDLKKGLADTAETFTYMRKLNSGQIAYLPMAKNFKLGDVIAFSDLKIGNNSTPDDIVNAIQNIYTSIDVRSVKFKAGGAASVPAKIELSIFKNNQTRINLNRLLQSYDLIWSNKGKQNIPAAAKAIVELGKNYKLDLRKMLAEGSGVITTVHKRAIAGGSNKDSKTLLRQMQLYYLAGKTMEYIYNTDVDYQLFSNERYTINKSGTTIDTTNGVNKLAKIKFKFDQFSNDRPNNIFATEFHHEDVSFDEPVLSKET